MAKNILMNQIKLSRMVVIALIGAMSGFTIMISSYTLNYWLSYQDINAKTIGIFSIVTLPYAINFSWAPIFDSTEFALLSRKFGRRISWLLIIQPLLAACVYILSQLMTSMNLFLIGVASLAIAFFASAQDSILGALKTEIIHKDQQGEIAGIYILGYRLGMLISSSGAIYLSTILSWERIYQLFCIIILFFPVFFIFANNHTNSNEYQESKKDHIVINQGLINNILSPIGSYRYIFILLLFLILYRLADNFLAAMVNPFLRYFAYESIDVAFNGKFLGTICAILGGIVASKLMKKKSLYYWLFIFGVIHAVAHLGYLMICIWGKSNLLLSIVTICEGTTSGMSMAAYIAFIASSCSGQYRATQYAFFSSMMGLSRSILPTISGYISQEFGWEIFFIFTTVSSIPALIIVLYLKYNKLDQ